MKGFSLEIRDFSLDLFSLRGWNAIVTGGNTGLGQAFTVALAKAGANVYVPSVIDDDGETRRLVEDAGSRFETLQIDLTEQGAPGRVVKSCVDVLGSVDILVNSAGISKLAPVAEFGRDEWDPMVALNLTAPFELGWVAARQMVEQGHGKIINVASLFSFLGGQMSPAYAAAKHGIVGFTKAYCDELGAHNIQCNAIAPGYFATPITAQTRANPVTNQRVLDHIPAGRWGELGDLMGALVFLASRASDYVNGHVLTVDGGYLTR
ncbi:MULTISPECIES: SDR family oxidoreductase [Prauserella salsuginis group]|uniref:SDR family oxidoreductase n=1 Tax=Prauserella salsuginis TaxID=387889 RepID=A0ABW6G846_9PSEU|nr:MULTISPECIES: SDR family oxidoreductase [Prauserella salsuginis group]MCR3721715.1 NAD(P)-dependent dehydrogenase, short-chain alcohol dehydrogenase family [Prauserella flava]MCR3734407.1 NAD(P)-dependent dehydrogenase, short-chain alcohol dehydrogenase family [Prauserella salsuginis]